MNEKLFVYAVGGVIFNTDKKILLAKRPLEKYLGGLWEIPGGKIEVGETSLQALVRELQEEVAIKVEDARFWFTTEHHYPDRKVKLDVWQVHQFVGEPYGVEGQAIEWVSLQALQNYEVPEGSQTIVTKLLSEFCS